MKTISRIVALCSIASFSLTSCSWYSANESTPPVTKPMLLAEKTQPVAPPTTENTAVKKEKPKPPDYAARMPESIESVGENVVIVNPAVHAWGAYDKSGKRVRAGLATAGAKWCPDIKRACRTRVGEFRVNSLGNAACKSTIYPLPKGGAPMPYCMFFNGNQGLHGSYNVVDANASHGCVRLKVDDAEWLRFNFIKMGTKVIVKPYS